MTSQEWTVGVLFLIGVSLAYAIGTRKQRPTPDPDSTPPKDDAAKASPKKARAATKEALGDAPEKDAGPDVTQKKPAPAAAQATQKKAAPEATQKKSAPEATPKKSGKRDGALPVLAKLEYEEDADTDPTKVGTPAAKAAIIQPPITRVLYDDDAAVEEPTQCDPPFLVSASAQTDTGLRRKRNEDSLLVNQEAGLFVVADGMGGYRGGELASQLAVKTLADAYRSNTFEGSPHADVPIHASELARAIQTANTAILDTAKAKPELNGMGTTLCAARFSANKQRLFICHVGDSRCYRLRAGNFRQMTADHTMADHGVTGPQAAHLSRAVGIWPTVPIDVVMAVPRPGDLYLLCSDGLTKMLTDNVIGDVLRAEADLEVAVERLILLSNAQGGKDNVTVVLVRVVPPPSRLGQSKEHAANA